MGTVQLGLAYGRINRASKPLREEALRLVRHASDGGIRTFDTARAYGDSEERLGAALEGRQVRIITKLALLEELTADSPRADVRAAIDNSIAESLAALRVSSLDCLLLHRTHHLYCYGSAVLERLSEHVAEGCIKALGVSVTSPEEARRAMAEPAISHIQAPVNLLDWRWHEADFMDAITARNDVTVHARSLFLQGLLATGDVGVWPAIDGVDVRTLLSWLEDTTRVMKRESTADLALAYVRGQNWIDGTVLGMATKEQLDTNLELAARPPLTAQECVEVEGARPHVPAQLLDPGKWLKQ